MFVFNLIVGVGALTLPLAFARGGLLLGTILLATCGIVAFVCVTFVIEACAISEHMSGRSEITDMTTTLLGKRQSFLCTVALIIYLYVCGRSRLPSVDDVPLADTATYPFMLSVLLERYQRSSIQMGIKSV